MDLRIEIERQPPANADEVICTLFYDGKRFARVSCGLDVVDRPDDIRKAFGAMLAKAASSIDQAQITIK